MSKIYHGNRIVDKTIGLEHLKDEITELITQSTGIENLFITGSTLGITTSQGELSVNLKPAIETLVTPVNDFPELFVNTNFNQPFGLGRSVSGWELEESAVGKVVIENGQALIDDQSFIGNEARFYQHVSGITVGAEYEITMRFTLDRGFLRMLTGDGRNGDGGDIVYADGVGKLTFVATTGSTQFFFQGLGAKVIFDSISLKRKATQADIDNSPSLLNNLILNGSTLVAKTNNGDKTVDLEPAINSVIGGGSVQVSVSNDTLDFNLGGVATNIPLEKFSPYRQKVGRQLLGDPDFNLPLSPATNPLPLKAWVSAGGWSIIDNKAIGVNATYLYQEFFTTSGSSYQIVVDVEPETVSGTLVVSWDGVPLTPLSGGINVLQTTTVTPNSRTRFHLFGNGNASAIVKSVTVTEILADASLTTPDRLQSLELSGTTLVLTTDKAAESVDLSGVFQELAKPSIVSETNTDAGGTIVFAPNLRTNKPERYEYRTTDSFGYTSHWTSCESFTITLGNSNYAPGDVEIREKENTFTGTEASESAVNTLAFTAVEGANTLYAPRVEGLYVSFILKNNTDANTYVDILRGTTSFDIVGRTSYATGFMTPVATAPFGPLNPGTYRAAANSGSNVASNVVEFTVHPLPIDLDPDRVLDFSLDTQARNIHLLTDKFEATLDISLLLPTDDVVPRISEYSDDDNYLIFLPNGRSPLATSYEYQTIHEGFTSEWIECESFTIFLGNGNYPLDSVRIRERALSDGSRPATDYCTNTFTFTQVNTRNTLKPVHVSGRTVEFKFRDTSDGNSYVRVEGVTNGFIYQSGYYSANSNEANTGFVDWGWPAGKYRAYINSGSNIRSNIEYFTIPGTPTPHTDQTPDRVENLELDGTTLTLTTDKGVQAVSLSSIKTDAVTSATFIKDTFSPGVPEGYTGFIPGGAYTFLDPRVITSGFNSRETDIFAGALSATATVSFYGQTITVTYYGSFRYSLDGGPWINIGTSSGIFKPVLLSAETTAEHTLVISPPGSEQVFLSNITITSVDTATLQDRARVLIGTSTQVFTADLSPLIPKDRVYQRGAGTNSIQPGSDSQIFDGNEASGVRSGVLSGQLNKVTNDYSVIAGGAGNTVTGQYSGILGGGANSAEGTRNVIVNGNANAVRGANNILGAGSNNNIYSGADASALIAGIFNQITGGVSFLGAGESNGVHATHAAIVCGKNNYIPPGANYGFIGGGQGNQSTASYSVAVGGFGNKAQSDYNFIGGGFGNNAGGGNSITITGGYGNNVFAEFATIVGGRQNTIQPGRGQTGFIGGGTNNVVDAGKAAVVGGEGNVVAGNYAFIGGGLNNNASGAYSTIPGGKDNVINTGGDYSQVSGLGNTASGPHCNIYGGSGNTITANCQNVTLVNCYNLTISGVTGATYIDGSIVSVHPPSAYTGATAPYTQNGFYLTEFSSMSSPGAVYADNDSTSRSGGRFVARYWEYTNQILVLNPVYCQRIDIFFPRRADFGEVTYTVKRVSDDAVIATETVSQMSVDPQFSGWPNRSTPQKTFFLPARDVYYLTAQVAALPDRPFAFLDQFCYH